MADKISIELAVELRMKVQEQHILNKVLDSVHGNLDKRFKTIDNRLTYLEKAA